jgi:hypothetical protein
MMLGLRGAALLYALLSLDLAAQGSDVPKPEDILGFPAGADFRLAHWPQVVGYFQKVDSASDRVVVRELGRTTEDRPYLVACVASPRTIANLDRYRDFQRRLADPRLVSPDSDPITDSKTVVLITCSIHSSETASTMMAMELLHELATKDDEVTRAILENTVLLLVPSANPDGVDKVAEWYERSKGHPWEGSGMPWLYHKYAGHDTNRDWFMVNLQETRLLTRLLYKDWFPTLTYDVHQMGTKGARLFVPPFYDPINPNLDSRIHQSIALIGAHMAADLTAAGKRGVLTHAMYDNWWNGGNRTTPQRHNMIGVLTEAASVRMASPIFVDKEELRGTARGFADQKPAANFVDPWPGGWWRLRDIIDYELICARSLLTLAARYRREFQANYLGLGRDAIRKGREEPPFGWVVPADQHDIGSAEEMVRILRDTGIEVRQARAPFRAGGIKYPALSWILSCEQPYRTHLKDMMERQVYPARFKPDGTAEAPYDVAGWTLPLQMGVKAAEIGARGETLYRADENGASGEGELFPLVDGPRKPERPPWKPTQGKARIGIYQPWVPSMDEGWTRLVLEKYGFTYTTLHNADVRAGELNARLDVLVIPSIEAKTLREGYAPEETEAAYVGGLGQEGVAALSQFVGHGGTLVCLEDSCHFVIDELKLDVKDVLKGLPTSTFYGPGSVLHVQYRQPSAAPGDPVKLTEGMPPEGSVYFDRSLAFETSKGSGARVWAEYATMGLLESGWLLGTEKVQGKAALVDVPLGQGRVILFGFPPQNRGQTHGTFRLLFNALTTTVRPAGPS